MSYLTELAAAIAAEREASDVCKQDLQARITALEAQIAAADRLAEAMHNLIDRYDEVVTTPDCSCSQDDYDVQVSRTALAAYHASRVQP